MDIFKSAPDKNFTVQYVDNRQDYYEEVKKLSADKEGIFYIVGSDEFLMQNIELLMDQGIKQENIMLDKRERQLAQFFSMDMSV